MGKLSKLIGDEVKQILDMSDAARMQRAKDMGFDTEKTLYHGTSGDFQEFDPKRKNDIGFHFGTKEQANEFVKKEGQIIPVYLKSKKTLELDFDPTVVDADSYVDSGYNFYRDMNDRVLEEAGIYRNNFMDEVRGGSKEANALYDARVSADNKIRKILDKEDADYRDVFDLKATKNYWSKMEAYLKSKGYDSIRYKNELEGLSGADNYSTAVFDKSQIRSINAKFDKKKEKSGNLLAGALPVGAIGAASMLSPNESYAQTVNKQAMPRPDDVGSIKAPVHPRAAQMAGYFDKYNRAIEGTPLGLVLPEAPADWANKLAYDGKTRIKDRIIAALGML